MRRTSQALIFAAMGGGLFMQPAFAATVADDVVCAGCVDGSDIASGTIGPDKLIPGSINATTIANASIGANKLVPGSITASVIANGVIGPNKLIPGSINATVIANASIGANKLIPGSINATVIAAGAINSGKLADSAVTTAKIADTAVSTAKIADSAVTSTKIAGSAVGNSQIAGGSVSYDKLDAGLQASVDGATSAIQTYDYRNVTGTTLSQAVFNLTGDFGNCGGAGTPDTEVRDFTRTDLGGGVTQVVQDRKRYVGGAGGTLCLRQVVTFINSATSNLLVRIQKYSAGGALLEDLQTQYDAATCNDCGLEIRRSDMVRGVDFASGDLWTESVSGDQGVVMTKVVLVEGNGTNDINEGQPSQETFTGCQTTWADRRAKNYWGYRSEIRVHCPTVGLVLAAHTDVTPGGTPADRLWELTSYTLTP